MSTADERHEIEARQADYQRLVEVYEILGDIDDAAAAVEKTKGLKDCQFERKRSEYALHTQAQVVADRREMWDRILVAKYGEAGAAQRWADAEARVAQRLEQRRIRQERRTRDVRRSR